MRSNKLYRNWKPRSFFELQNKTDFMISCYELRIGNYVLVDEHLQQVSALGRTTASTFIPEQNDEQAVSEHNLENIQPVLLTDDIIKQCGFVFHDYFKFWQLITTGIRSEMNLSPDYEVIDFMRKPILKKLTSLHQLQNIYFLLKGRELQLVQ
jgi:hypothetical protein